MKVKVCGIWRKEDLKAIAEIPPDFVGFVLYPQSPRYAGNNLKELSQLPLCVETKRVGVFVNEKIETVVKACKEHLLDFAQLHGNETPEYCREVNKFLKVIKAFNVDESFDFSSLELYDNVCDYFLFDAKGKLQGGNSTSFDWNILQRYNLQKPFFLSGGIKPEHVKELMSLKHPSFFAADINSGFETAPGEKNPAVIKTFIQQIKQYA